MDQERKEYKKRIQNPAENLIEKKIQVITTDGRVLLGTLKGLDQALNAVIADCEERVYSRDGIKIQKLGLYLLRGDNVAVIGDVDEEIDDKLDLGMIAADPLKPLIN